MELLQKSPSGERIYFLGDVLRTLPNMGRFAKIINSF